MSLRAAVWVGVLAWALLASAGSVGQQGATRVAAPLAYDVVTVKENKSQGYVTLAMFDKGDLLKMENGTLMSMVQDAFDLQGYLIEGMPGWGQKKAWDVQGKILEGTPEQIKALTMEQRRAMVRAVLVDRFGLKTHWVTRDKPEYELVVAKGGSKLKESTAKQTSSGLNWGDLNAEDITTDDLAESLAYVQQRPVVNRTGLTGRYDVHLKWSVEGQKVNGEEVENTAPSMFTAVKETLGLELKSTHGPVQVLVVDGAEEPSAN